VLVEQYDPERVILFGSFARGDIHEWSDLDWAIVKRTEKPFMARLKEVALLTLPRVGTEMLVYTPEEIEQAQAKHQHFMVEEILGQGRILDDKEQEQCPPIG